MDSKKVENLVLNWQNRRIIALYEADSQLDMKTPVREVDPSE